MCEQVFVFPRQPKLILFVCVSAYLQYSEKEDKYEEEIKVLTDKLKEVRPGLMKPQQK